MDITIRTVGDVTVVELVGPATANEGVPGIEEALQLLVVDGCVKIVVNWVNALWVDDAALKGFMKGYAAVSRRGGVIKLVLSGRRCCPFCSGLFKLLTVFDGYDTEAEAIASFGGGKA